MATFFNIAKVKTNFPEADFWLVRKGSELDVGKPTNIFKPQHIGVKVERLDIIYPKYLFYVVHHLHSIGYFKRRCNGTLSLKHITVNDVEKIKLG